MNKFDELLREAKPLYKSRKRRKLIAKATLAVMIPMMFFTMITTLYIEGDSVYALIDNGSIQTQLLEDDFGLIGIE